MATTSDVNPGGATVWDARSGDELATLDHDDDERVDRVAFSPASNRLLVTASSDSAKARVWDWHRNHSVLLARRGEGSTHPEDDDDAPALAAFSPDGKRVATALAEDTKARVWDASTGRLLFRPVAGDVGSGISKEAVISVDWSRDGRRLLVAGGKTAQIVDGRTGRPANVLRGHSNSIDSAAFSPSGRMVVTASEDGTARVWSAASGTELRELRGHKVPVRAASFAGNDSQVVTAGLDKRARLWDVASGRPLVRHEDWVLDASYSRDGRRVVTASADATARVTSLAHGKPVPIDTDGQANSARFDRGARRVVVADAGGAFVADARNLKSSVSLELRRPVVYAEFSPDGRQVVTAGESGTALWDPDQGTRSMRLLREEQLSAAFSPNGRRVVTAGVNGVARVFDVRKGRKIAEFDKQGDGINSVAFSRDGRAIVSAGADGTAGSGSRPPGTRSRLCAATRATS